LDLATLWEKIFESWVGILAVLDVIEWFQWSVFLPMVPGWQIMRILGGVNLDSS
jgi:hypothetical protein